MQSQDQRSGCVLKAKRRALLRSGHATPVTSPTPAALAGVCPLLEASLAPTPSGWRGGPGARSQVPQGALAWLSCLPRHPPCPVAEGTCDLKGVFMRMHLGRTGNPWEPELRRRSGCCGRVTASFVPSRCRWEREEDGETGRAGGVARWLSPRAFLASQGGRPQGQLGRVAGSEWGAGGHAGRPLTWKGPVRSPRRVPPSRPFLVSCIGSPGSLPGAAQTFPCRFLPSSLSRERPEAPCGLVLCPGSAG